MRVRSSMLDASQHFISSNIGHPVDGQNPAPVDRQFIPIFTRFDIHPR